MTSTYLKIKNIVENFIIYSIRQKLTWACIMLAVAANLTWSPLQSLVYTVYYIQLLSQCSMHHLAQGRTEAAIMF